jgi:hypothetical protein
VVAPGPLAGEGASARRRWLALVVLCVGPLMLVLDATVVDVTAWPSGSGPGNDSTLG